MFRTVVFLFAMAGLASNICAQVVINGTVTREADGTPIDGVQVRATVKRTGLPVAAAPGAAADIRTTQADGVFRLTFAPVNEAVILDFTPPPNRNAAFHSLILLGGEAAQDIKKRLPPAGARSLPGIRALASQQEAQEFTNRLRSNVETLLVFEEFYYRSLTKPRWDDFDHAARNRIREWLENFEDPIGDLRHTSFGKESIGQYQEAATLSKFLSTRRGTLYALYGVTAPPETAQNYSTNCRGRSRCRLFCRR